MELQDQQEVEEGRLEGKARVSCRMEIQEQLQEQPEIQNHIWGSQLRTHETQKKHNTKKPPTVLEASLETNKDDTPTEDDDIGLNDLQRLANLKISGHRRQDPQSQPAQVKTSKTVQRMFTCNKCDTDHTSSEELEEHLDTHYEDGDFTCDTCLFQTSKMSLLRKHLQNSPGHLSGQVHGKAAIKCKFCEEKFIVKKDLIAHKNNRHKTHKTCDFFLQGNCKRSPCRYSHKKIKEGNCVCYECGKDYTSTAEMYKHRKKEHKRELCKKFLNNECDRGEADCWFSHVTSATKSPALQVSTTHEKVHKIKTCQPRVFGHFPQSQTHPHCL